MLPILKVGFIMVNISNMPSGVVDDLAFTKEELEELKRAREMPIVFDEDSPELTPAMEKAFRLAAKNRNTQRKTMIS